MNNNAKVFFESSREHDTLSEEFLWLLFVKSDPTLEPLTNNIGLNYPPKML